jgi:hypothetical protein
MAASALLSCDCKDCSTCSCCLTGFDTRTDSYDGDIEACPYALIVKTDNKAPIDGMYACNGFRDDKATVSWPSGSKVFETGDPQRPCAGTGSWSVDVSLKKDDIVTCRAQSWGGPITCRISCCIIKAP